MSCIPWASRPVSDSTSGNLRRHIIPEGQRVKTVTASLYAEIGRLKQELVQLKEEDYHRANVVAILCPILRTNQKSYI